MKRRLFIKNSTLSSLAITLSPTMTFSQEKKYSTEELMGKTEIKLYGKDINLRKEAHDAFVAMKKEAYNAGIDLKIVSSYRNFYRQKAIFEKKFIRYTEENNMKPINAIDKIIEYSTIPGTSRHHWGTDIDIVDGYKKVQGDVLVPSKFEAGGPYEDLKKWMDENSKKFNYHIVYTNNSKRKGFKYEPWHYSYAPISIPMLTDFRRKNIFQLLQNETFEGCEHFTHGFLKNYIQNNILSINEELL